MSMSKSEQSGKSQGAPKGTTSKELLASTRRSELFMGRLVQAFKEATVGLVDRLARRGEFDDAAARRVYVMMTALEEATRQSASGKGSEPRVHKETTEAASELANAINTNADTMAEILFLTLEATLVLLLNGFQVVQYHFEEEEKSHPKMEKGLVDPRTCLLASLSFFVDRVEEASEKLMQVSDAIADNISAGQEPSDELRSKFYSF